jgi:hypothetical protein
MGGQQSNESNTNTNTDDKNTNINKIIIKKKIEFSKFEVVMCPSERYNEIKPRLAEISSIAEPEDEFDIWDGSLILVGYTSDGIIQAYLTVIDTQSYIKIGKKYITDIYELYQDFRKRGGLMIPGTKGGFLTSLSGNVNEYYDLGNGMMEQLYRVTDGLDYLFLHVSESKPTKDKLIRLYEKYGFKIIEPQSESMYTESNGEKFIIMRKTLKSIQF